MHKFHSEENLLTARLLSAETTPAHAMTTTRRVTAGATTSTVMMMLHDDDDFDGFDAVHDDRDLVHHLMPPGLREDEHDFHAARMA
ncbi:hypothetical protein PINS_up001341 [Pythium insidiosum]|nr:hypothetical protein PINS_up001341 [Pythium insidiosum]